MSTPTELTPTTTPMSPSNNQPPSHKFCPDVIIKSATKKYENGDIAGSEMMYQQALLEWVDEAIGGSGDHPDEMRRNIAVLWIAYADLYKNMKQWKRADEAYESAIQCPVAGSVADIWLSYAKLHSERDRPNAAQKIYLRALTGDGEGNGAVEDESGLAILWDGFLQLMRDQRKDPDLSLETLKQAVETEHVQTREQQTKDGDDDDDNAEMKNNDDDGDGNERRPEKKAKINRYETTDSNAMNSAPTENNPASSTTSSAANDTKALQINKAKSIEAALATLLSNTQSMAPELMALWLARDGDASPSRPEPLFSPNAPKLQDASGKDLVGLDLALELVQLLLKIHDRDMSGALVLEICRGCWAMQALKEREAMRALKVLEDKMNKDLEKLEATLTARASVAGAAIGAVETMNANERNEFLAGCNHERQKLVDFYSWEFRHLLSVQQQILTSARLPLFDGPCVDPQKISVQAKICTVMHSAFFLRVRVGEAAHNTMLTKLESRLQSEKANANTQPQLGIPNIPPPPPHPRMTPPPIPPHGASDMRYRHNSSSNNNTSHQGKNRNQSRKNKTGFRGGNKPYQQQQKQQQQQQYPHLAPFQQALRQQPLGIQQQQQSSHLYQMPTSHQMFSHGMGIPGNVPPPVPPPVQHLIMQHHGSMLGAHDAVASFQRRQMEEQELRARGGAGGQQGQQQGKGQFFPQQPHFR